MYSASSLVDWLAAPSSACLAVGIFPVMNFIPRIVAITPALTATSPSLPDGNWYFSIRTVDVAGNSQAGYNVIAVTVSSGGSHINAKLAHHHRPPHVRRRR